MDKNLKAVFELIQKTESENGVVLVGYRVGFVVIEPVIMRRVIQNSDVAETKKTNKSKKQQTISNCLAVSVLLNLFAKKCTARNKEKYKKRTTIS